MNRFNLIIFDFDGTLVDTSKAITHAINLIRRRRNMDEVSTEYVRSVIGGGIGNTLKVVFNEHYDESILNEFKEIYSTLLKTHVQPYGGMEDVLKTLKLNGKKLSILSNAHTNFILNILNSFGMDTYFDEIVGFDRQLKPKPHPWGVNYLMGKFSSFRAETVLVGDSLFDLKTARNGGIKMIFVKWGYGNDVNADFVVETPYELLNILL